MKNKYRLFIRKRSFDQIQKLLCIVTFFLLLAAIWLYCYVRIDTPYIIGFQGKEFYFFNLIPFRDIPITLSLIPGLVLEKHIFFTIQGILCCLFIRFWKGENWKFHYWFYLCMVISIIFIIEFSDAFLSSSIGFDINNIFYYGAGFFNGRIIYHLLVKKILTKISRKIS